MVKDLANSSITIIIPAYNESSRIENAVETTIRNLMVMASNYEVIISEDGSNDGTYEISAKLKEGNSRIRLLHSRDRGGKGLALKKAINVARGDIIGFIDADLATDMSYLPALLNAIRIDDYDIAIGSRLEYTNKTDRSHKRSIASKTYNQVVRKILGSKLHDHQCGFKAFKRDSICKILDKVKDERWFWDTELLIRAQREGYKIKELPVKWNEANSTSFNFLRDSLDMGLKIIRLWWDLARN
jgi:glycosyltransferase AglD